MGHDYYLRLTAARKENHVDEQQQVDEDDDEFFDDEYADQQLDGAFDFDNPIAAEVRRTENLDNVENVVPDDVLTRRELQFEHDRDELLTDRTTQLPSTSTTPPSALGAPSTPTTPPFVVSPTGSGTRGPPSPIGTMATARSDLRVRLKTFSGKSKEDPDCHIAQFERRWLARQFDGVYDNETKRDQLEATLEGNAMDWLNNLQEDILRIIMN